MMNFEEFQTFVVDSIKSYLPAEYVEADVRVNTIRKENSIEKVGLNIVLPNTNISPNIYLNEYYNDFLMGNTSMDTILKNISNKRVELGKNAVPTLDVNFSEFNSVKKHIVPKLINAEANKGYLLDKPHMLIEDLAVVYRIVAGYNSDGMYSSVINFKTMESYGLNSNELHEIAISNLSKESPSTFKSMFEAVYEPFIEELIRSGCSREESIETAKSMISEALPLYVISNTRGINGASALLDEKIMDEVRKKLGENIFVLPSSIHECIVVPDDSMTPVEMLKDMVNDVNGSMVAPNEVLSNNVYRYDFNNKKLVIATDSKKIEKDLFSMPGANKSSDLKSKGGR